MAEGSEGLIGSVAPNPFLLWVPFEAGKFHGSLRLSVTSTTSPRDHKRTGAPEMPTPALV